MTPLKLLPYAVGMIAVIGAILIRSESHTIASPTFEPVQKRIVAPEFSLKDSTGATVRLSDYKGKVVLLNFWATWCGPCNIEIPTFTQFERTYKDQGFAVLGVSMDQDGWKAIRPFLERHQVNYRVLLGDEGVSRSYGGIDTLPTSLLIDRQGRIAVVHVGLESPETYQQQILELLKAGNPPANRT